MSTYQCCVCFYICDLNLEVIEIFQANNYRLPHWKRWKFPEIRPGIFGRMVSALDVLKAGVYMNRSEIIVAQNSFQH